MFDLLLSIKILKWSDYNPRKDFKKPWWFALSNTLIDDPEFFSFSHGEFKAWIYILSMASRKNNDTVKIDLDHAYRVSSIAKKDFLNAIKKLELLQMVIGICTDSVRETNATGQDRTEQDRGTCADQTKVLVPAEIPPELLEIKQELDERNINSKSIKSILQAYPEPVWLISEFRKMFIWEATNPRKKKKNFGPFAARWLAKSWDERKLLGAARGPIKTMRRVGENV